MFTVFIVILPIEAKRSAKRFFFRYYFYNDNRAYLFYPIKNILFISKNTMTNMFPRFLLNIDFKLEFKYCIFYIRLYLIKNKDECN